MARYTATDLANGYVANAEGDIHTVPAGERHIVTRMDFKQLHATLQTIIIYIQKSGGSSFEWDRTVDLPQYGAIEFYDLGLVLNDGDKIRAVTTTASAVRFWLYGAVEVVA